ncbi:conserved hypothetical protein [Mucor ambiguus]|uniref:Protein kinase domain-containing protein n=1 Tax=Mucor ambiguus TaxID=91626 RepID=A0A0C9LSH2_9FUNG|nr:conserved hypothetical protein [Mucor ambiguus]
MEPRKESPLIHYELLKQIGDGSFGSVHKARKIASNKIVAIKIMKKKLNGDHIKEYNTLKKLTAHPNIVKLYETFIDTTKDFYFVMEYMNGGNLYQFIKDRKEAFDNIQASEVKIILFHILSGLHHIHHVEGIFHRDMKPENLLISYDNDTLLVKLADFGLATSIKSKPPYTIYTSTRWYRAPEILLRSSTYSYPIDLWAVGTIFAELVTLRPLFPGQSEIDQLFRICQVLGSPGTTSTVLRKKSYHQLLTHQKIPSPLVNMHTGIGGEWKDGVKLAQKMGFQFPKISPRIDCLSSVLQPHPISNDGLDLLSKLLQFDPYKRITSSEALNHPFFTHSNDDNAQLITTGKATSTLFDLPIIPLSPFKLEEYSQWDLLKKRASPTVYSQEEQEQVDHHASTPSSFPRTNSYPSELYSITSCDNNVIEHCMMKRSISDLSIPSNITSHQEIQKDPQQKKKPIIRLSLWARKHIIV